MGSPRIRSSTPISRATGTEVDPVYLAWDKSTGISITESQISDLQAYLLAGDNVSDLVNDAGYLTDISGQDLSIANNSTSQFITQGDIDWATNVPANETDPLSLHLDQTSPQTISNGFPVYPAGHAAFTDEHQIIDKEYVDKAVTAINTNYYMLDSASGVSDYKDTQIPIPSVAEATDVHTVTADDQYLRGWISPAGETPPTLVAGEYELHVHADVDATLGTKRIQLYWEMVEYKADTTEDIIATSALSDEITTSTTHESIFLTLADDYTPAVDSRIVGKLYAHLYGSGNNPDVTIYYLGTINSAWRIPSSTEVLTSLFVPYTGAVNDVDLGSYNFATTGSIGVTGSRIL